MGTVSDWHKKQRKKELKKNKEARLAARNERVVTEKSIPGIQKEIAALEAAPSNAQHSTQMKIDRLRKELKLLQKHQETVPKQRSAAKPTAPRTPMQEPLPDPRVSIYYDASMNPFGEPPPGRPRLFHRRGGGTTLTLREAVVPGEEGTVQHETTVEDTRSTPPDQQQKNIPKNPKPHEATKAKVRHSSKQAPVGRSNASQTSTSTNGTRPLSNEPKKVPELPQASAAVKRSKKLAVDIWASTSELEYDESWEYRDLVANEIQGPFGTEQMLTWIRAGHFPGQTIVRRVNTKDWKPMSDVKELWGSSKKRKVDVEPTEVQKRIAALRGPSKGNSTDSDQRRIATLRGNDPPMDDVQSRIAALRGNRQEVVTARVEQMRDGEEVRSTTMDIHSEKDMILRGDTVANAGEIRSPQDPSLGAILPMPPPPESQILDVVEESGAMVQSRNPADISLPPPLPPPPPGPQMQKDVNDAPSYPLDKLPVLPLPPPPTASALPSDVDVPVYPLPLAGDDPDFIEPYPMPSPPQDNSEIIAPYPIIPPKDGALVTSSKNADGPLKQTNPRLNLKTVTIDKSLAAFLPTALQRKRPQK